MKILFIGGFGSNVEENKKNVYYNFNIYFKLSTHTVDYFTYKTNEDLNIVLEKISFILQNDDNNYDTILTHSMGGCLITKYISIHPEFNKKVIMMMPFICKPFYGVMTNIPFVKYLYLPKIFMVRNNKLATDGNIMNDDWLWFISFRQIYQSVKTFMLTTDDLIELLNKNKNIHMIYATGESVSIIPKYVLNKIENKSIINGKHGAFCDMYYSEQFFDTLTQLLLSKDSSYVAPNVL